MSQKRNSAASSKTTASDAPPPGRFPAIWGKRNSDGALFIRWKVLLVYTLSGLFAVWLIAVVSLFFFVKYRSGHTTVKFTHIIGLPFTLKDYRESKGKFWIELGLEAAKQNQWHTAFGLLRQGLPHDPSHEEARRYLAQIYLMAGRPELARGVLLEGLPYHSDQDTYLRTVITTLFSQQADEAVVEAVDGVLKNGDLPLQTQRMLAVAKLYALFNRDRFEQIPAAIESGGLRDAVEAKFIEARVAWETGTPETALALLRVLHARVPQDGEIYRTLLLYLRESDRMDEARRLALSRSVARPNEPDAYLDFISICAEAGEVERQNQAINDYLRLFALDANALTRLSIWASRTGAASLAWRIVELCPLGSEAARNTRLLAIEAELALKTYTEADRRAAEALAADLGWNQSQRLTLLGMQGIAQIGLGKVTEGQGLLARMLDSSAVAAPSLTSLAKQARRAGDEAAAVRMLERALKMDASHQPALIELLEIQMAAGHLDRSLDLVERLPQTRKPSPVFMRSLIEQLESDAYLYVPARHGVVDKLQNRLRQAGAEPVI